MIVVVVFVLAGLAVLGAVVALAMGRGGELAEAHPDYAPLPATDGPLTARDAARLRLPRTFWGYQPQLTDEALHRLAAALSEREARVALLEQELRDLRGVGEKGGEDDPEDEPEDDPEGDPEGDAVGALDGLEETGANGTPPWLRKDGTADQHPGEADASVEHGDARNGLAGSAFAEEAFGGDTFGDDDLDEDGLGGNEPGRDGFAEDEPVGGTREERR